LIDNSILETSGQLLKRARRPCGCWQCFGLGGAGQEKGFLCSVGGPAAETKHRSGCGCWACQRTLPGGQKPGPVHGWLVPRTARWVARGAPEGANRSRPSAILVAPSLHPSPLALAPSFSSICFPIPSFLIPCGVLRNSVMLQDVSMLCSGHRFATTSFVMLPRSRHCCR